MALDFNRARADHFSRMQKALEEGLKSIGAAETQEEADAARLRAQARMEELNRMWRESFPQEQVV